MQVSFLKAQDAYGNIVLFNAAAIIAIMQEEQTHPESTPLFTVRLMGDVSFNVKAKDEREALHALGMSTFQIQK